MVYSAETMHLVLHPLTTCRNMTLAVEGDIKQNEIQNLIIIFFSLRLVHICTYHIRSYRIGLVHLGLITINGHV